MLSEARLIFFHKQSTSARTRFLRFEHGVLGFSPLPADAVVRPAAAEVVRAHPAALINDAAQRLGLPLDALCPLGEFYAEVASGEHVIPVLLIQFTAIDPPFAAVDAVGGRFVSITETRRLPTAELELLRRAYEVLLG
jgi:hypothetical protein